MELWFNEFQSADSKFSFRVRRQLFSRYSDFQHIQVLDTYEFGRVLVMDGFIMTSEKDEFIYHEMVTHVPLAVHPQVRKALIIGGGDGGTLRELCRYPDIEDIVMVEIDPLVVEVSRKYLPTLAVSFDDPRVTILHEDGLRYVRRCHDMFDLIIVDSTDPFGPGESLFTREFYSNCKHALKADGILVNQHEGPYYREDAEEASAIHRKTSSIFAHARVYQAHIPTYPAGHWLFGFMSDSWDPVADLDRERWEARGLETRYYNPDLHRGAFLLPTYVRRLLEEGEILDDVFVRAKDRDEDPEVDDHE
ncbi:MAG TPA: polyamine aminopropyltransferase [Clostridiaceae bacterium]|nr:polyamine aminopropyltransferase [Clostridiaceae bacterium]